MQNEMRERLIELIETADNTLLAKGLRCTVEEVLDLPSRNEFIADHLLANGVIVPPCKVGDTIYRIASSEHKQRIWEWEVYSVTIYGDEIVFQDDSDNIFYCDDIGKTVFLSKEEAEKALRGKNNAE